MFPEGLARSFLYILFGCFRSNPGVKRTLDEMKEDEERIKEVTKAREMKKAMKKKKVKARNGSLACFVVTKLLYSWKSHCTVARLNVTTNYIRTSAWSLLHCI